MASRKKKSVNALQEIYDSIMESLSRIKPLLDDPKHPDFPSVMQDLNQVASLAENFTEQRPKFSRSSWNDLADSLDQEGVNLWNISGLLRKYPQENSEAHTGGLRLAAFRLVEAGLEVKPAIETLIHVLQLASKTGMTLCDLGNNLVASSVLTSAAKFEEQLRNATDSEGTHRQAIASATVVYFSGRMEAAWKEGNHTVADYMSRKITDDNQRLNLLPPHAREHLAFKLHQIGRSILREPAVQDGSKPADAVQWLQRAFSIADQLEDTAVSGIAELKITILRTMARAYFLSESYDRAESVLDELIPTIDASNDHASSEYQELRWLRLAVLKRRKAGDPAVLDAFKSIIDHMAFSETSITDVLQELKTYGSHHTLVTAVNQHCLEQSLRRHTTEPDHIHRLVLSQIIHSSKDEDHARAMKTLESTLTSVCEADVELPSVPTTACLTLLWQYGGRHYKAKRWSEAADWYITGSHKLFRTNSPSSAAKCFRKAALCHIEKREYAQASTVIRRCPTNEAPTHYVIFLAAVHQGLEEEAIRAIHDMLKAPDFDRKMLLLATQISHRSEMKGVLLAVLESLLKTLKIGSNGEVVIEALTLVRCIIKLVLNLLAEPAANKPVLIDTVVNQFRTARILTEAASTQKMMSLVLKDISWLWRTAYNCAVQGCSEWENAGDQISELFGIAGELLEASCHASPLDTDANLYLHLAHATFAAVSGRVFWAREILMTVGAITDERLNAIITEIKTAKAKVTDISTKIILHETEDSDRIPYILHALRIYEAEISVQLKEWKNLSQIVEEVAHTGPLAIGTYEAIADILWLDKACPVSVLYRCLEAILRASLEHSAFSVEKFSRWLRAICTISLARDTPADRVKAIGYVEQALGVIEAHSDSEEPYPMDERQWLLATSYNTGTECLQSVFTL
ncbi:meiosis protein SPO22/ZIP4 like-domain-containing protein [Crassisporium funariophilum]|nr:meiosis protein SPO22/ZIP4 like-domain-containing protein [Crassisporium funariophilum]